MAVVLRNDIDPGYGAVIPFLAAQDQHVQQQRALAEEEQRRRQEEEQQQLAALAQLAQSVPQQQPVRSAANNAAAAGGRAWCAPENRVRRRQLRVASRPSITILSWTDRGGRDR
jgi:hypothetical protein